MCIRDRNGEYKLGPNDLDLAKRISKAGSDHRKFLRQVFGSVDVTAPLYWWKEYDTYKVDVYKRQILCLSSGLLILLFGFTFARHILTLMNTKPELIDGAVRYLRIYVFGMPALALFNFCLLYTSRCV